MISNGLKLTFDTIHMFFSVAEARTPVSQVARCFIGWNDDDANVDIANLDCLHKVGEIVRQQITARRYLKLYTHAPFGAVITETFCPVDAARLDDPPTRYCRKPLVEHYAQGCCAIPVRCFS